MRIARMQIYISTTMDVVYIMGFKLTIVLADVVCSVILAFTMLRMGLIHRLFGGAFCDSESTTIHFTNVFEWQRVVWGEGLGGWMTYVGSLTVRFIALLWPRIEMKNFRSGICRWVHGSDLRTYQTDYRNLSVSSDSRVLVWKITEGQSSCKGTILRCAELL